MPGEAGYPRLPLPTMKNQSKTFFFFRKRSKKTLMNLGLQRFHHPGPVYKNFFAAFFKKEALAFRLFVISSCAHLRNPRINPKPPPSKQSQ
jgi:hypothetical protein